MLTYFKAIKFKEKVKRNASSEWIQIHSTVKVDFKELLIKEQIDFKELLTDYQLFYAIDLLLNKELLLM